MVDSPEHTVAGIVLIETKLYIPKWRPGLVSRPRLIERLVLQALAHQAQANISHALDPLERALTLAEPEGYLRIFVDEGEPMRPPSPRGCWRHRRLLYPATAVCL